MLFPNQMENKKTFQRLEVRKSEKGTSSCEQYTLFLENVSNMGPGRTAGVERRQISLNMCNVHKEF